MCLTKKEKRITEIVGLLGYGHSIKEIAGILNLSESTIYKDYQEYRVNSIHAIEYILYKIDKLNVRKSLESLTYSDICVLSKRFQCGYWIRKKSKKIEKLVPFLNMFYYFNLNPANYTKDQIKIAYFRKAKEVHPDKTKRDTSKEFNDLNTIYNTLLKTIEAMI